MDKRVAVLLPVIILLVMYMKTKKSSRGGGEGKKKKVRGGVGMLMSMLMPSVGAGEGRLEILIMALLCFVRIYLMSLSSKLYQKLVEADLVKGGRFWKLWRTVIMLGMAHTLNDQTIKYYGKRLGIVWREKLTKTLHDSYFKGFRYYSATHGVTASGDIIAADVKEVTGRLSQMIAEGLHAVTAGVFFSYLVGARFGARYAIMPYLYLWMGFVLSSKIAPVNWAKVQGQIRNNFTECREAVSRVVTHQEPITAQKGEQYEKAVIERNFKTWVASQHVAGRAVIWSGFVSQTVFKWWIRSFLGTMVIGPYTLRGIKNMDEKTMQQLRSQIGYHFMLVKESFMAAGNTAKILYQLNQIQGSVKRVCTLITALEETPDPQGNFVHEDAIKFDNVQIAMPTGQVLVDDLTFSLEKGDSLLLTGHNGAGKSSIFRCLGGLWSINKGLITKPGSDGDEGLHHKVYYLPQKPYTVLGDLSSQITYPDDITLDEPELREILSEVGLEYLVDSTITDWEGLSLGEQQRLAIARLLHHKPSFAILDECTSGVSGEMEKKLYMICKMHNITYITISHRPVLKAFHKRMLEIGLGDGKYEFSDLSSFEEPDYGVSMSPMSPGKKTTEEVAQQNEKPKTDCCESQWPALDVVRMAWPENGNAKLAAIATCLVGQSYMQTKHSVIFGGMLGSIFTQDSELFFDAFKQGSVCSVVGSVFEQVMEYIVREWNTEMKQKLTERFSKKLLEPNACYNLTQIDGRIKDPHHRMTLDVVAFSDAVSELIPQLVNPLVTIGFSVSGMAQFVGAETIGVVAGYVVAGYGIIKVSLPDSKTLVKKESGEEAQLCSIHSRVTRFAESIAFIGGGQRERLIVEKKMKDVLAVTEQRVKESWKFGLVNGMVVREGPTALYWLVRHEFNKLSGALNSKTTEDYFKLAQGHVFAQEAVQYIFSALGQLLDSTEKIESLSGNALRIVELDNAFSSLKTDRNASRNYRKAQHVQVTDGCIQTPTGVSMASGLNLTVTPETPLMVTGPNACGKTGFFRMLCGLWPTPTGTVETPQDMFLVPQSIFMVSGTLADQITYPVHVQDKQLDSELCCKLLELVGIGYLSGREGWHHTKPWENILSLGEQQRLGMARLFYNKPKFAILDECTSAVSTDVEHRLYKEAKNLGVTCITLSQRLALNEFHTQELALNSDKTWKILDVE
eukprot:TRINITY_DN898_c3_g1_i2.p1 TRINITY_DN898_c3_g1~~TRINITY_DN898_c3_g1_i2.p1  ORF type:complete len:1188 (+),score=383.74 TRINITY_DN898_c3_g1_i2:66-3629(+)